MNTTRRILLSLTLAVVACTTQSRAATLYGAGYEHDVFTIDQENASGTILGYPANDPISGLAFSPAKRLFGSVVHGGSNPGDLIEIDPATGALINSIGQITDSVTMSGIKISDLSFQPGSGILFGITAGGGGSGSGGGKLYTINTETAVATLIGPTCADPSIGAAIAFAADGTLYLIGRQVNATNNPAGSTTDILATIDPATGQCLTTITTDRFYQGLAVRPEDGTIFASEGDTQDVYIINPATGGSFYVGEAPDYIGDMDFLTTGRQLVNISTRASVGTGQKVAISGFIVRSEAAPDPAVAPSLGPTPPSKHVLIRGLGSSLLVHGVPLANRLEDPVLDLYDGNGELLATNDNWRDTQQSEIQNTGLPPTADSEAAMVVMLASDANYTTVLRGKDNTTGIGLVEVYDLDNVVGAESHLVNISTRAFVSTDNDVLIGGTMVTGDEPIRVLIRAIGPSLAAGGIAGALQDPTLELYDGNANLIASNDDWVSSMDMVAIAATGAAPPDSRESAILAEPDAAPYTAVVRGKNGTTGIGLVEAYNVGPPPPPAATSLTIQRN